MYGASASLLLTVSFPVKILRWTTQTHSQATTKIYGISSFVGFVFAISLSLTFLLLPRRPDVYQQGTLVDQQYTVSALSRATFAWATPLVSKISRNKNISYDDLPAISSDIRAQTLRQNFANVGKKDRYWKSVFWSHKATFVSVWSVQVVQSFTNFLPQIALYYALRTLEARDTGAHHVLRLWLIVLALGASDAISTWIESWFFYICYLKLGTPIYEQVGAVVFHKAVRKKDVKSVSGISDTSETQNGAVVTDEGTGDQGEDTVHDQDVDEDVAKTKQSTINLIGVDGKRISDFATYNAMILGSAIKLVIAVTFLVKLVGWVAMLAGFAVLLVLAPVNWLITKRYTIAQDELMKQRDLKMAVVTEALQGIRQIKFSALEGDWYDKILRTRAKELRAQWRAFMCDAMLISIWIAGPLFLSAVCLAVYAFVHKELSASTAFTTVSVFEAIEVTLAVVPELITEMFDALISCRRIQEYLDSPDREDVIKPGSNISFDNATIAWPTDEKNEADGERFRLHNLDISFPLGELSVVSGPTGSGKSLLLSAIIGEADVLQGTVTVPRAPLLNERFDSKANKSNWIITEGIAYVAQIPWIENATIKDNILFGLPLDTERYQEVIHASALEKDLEMLQDGDLTDIGANGINLSGGQKWRVSFARALYSRAGTLILDDIFSAVDAHVGRHLFETALTGRLGHGRTRILVTHHVALCLPKTVYSVLLEDGTVAQAGLTDELRRHGLLKDILAYDAVEQKKEQEQADQDQAVMIDDGGSLQKTISNRSDLARRIHRHSTSEDVTMQRTSSTSEEPASQKQLPKKFVEEEKREIGAVKWTIYSAYIKACGGYTYWGFIFLVFLFWVSIYLGRTYWVSVWTRASDTKSDGSDYLIRQTSFHFQTLKKEFSLVKVDRSVYFYVGIYLSISVGQWLIGSFKYYFVYVASIRASKKLFESIAHAILHAPLRFLDTTPVGRIVNRFTADFNLIDSRISYDVMFTMHSGISALAVVIAGIFVSPIMLLFAVVLLMGCLWYALRYLSAAREVKRLESNAKSPVFEQFGSVLTGIGTIRAFDKAEEYIQRMDQKINSHCRAYYHLWLFNRWMGLRVAWVGALFVTATAALIVGLPNVDASLAGFALSFSLQLSGKLMLPHTQDVANFIESIIWLLRQYANVELDLNAVERVVEYADMPIEDQSGHDAPAAWPTKGEIEVHDLVVAYAPDLSPVLRGLSFSVRQNERVGVVGRTGAGKSSLTLALFRFLEARSGSIHIDGIDTSKIKLADLRSRLAIIPQDPVLFSGTVRSNLDPFNQHSDAELRDALIRVHLISPSSAQSGTATPDVAGSSSTTSSTLRENTGNVNIFSSLTSKISEGGLNLSQGQRQLLCLARAIVSRPKVLVLDEATSSVDMATDALIQRSIREEFVDSTLMVIAHRLSTIADFDRILVLGEGKVVEYDKPEVLLTREHSAFREMVESSGERAELEVAIRERQRTAVA